MRQEHIMISYWHHEKKVDISEYALSRMRERHVQIVEIFEALTKIWNFQAFKTQSFEDMLSPR